MNLHAFHQTRYALCIAVAAARELNVRNYLAAVLLNDVKVDLLGT